MRTRGRRFAPTTPASTRFLAGLRGPCVLGLLALLGRRPAHALVRLNDGTDQIYITGTYTIAHDSNINASSNAAADTISTYAAEVEYQRRAGLIGVNASGTFTWNEYAENRDFDNFTPAFALEFDKGTGRETGSLGFNAVESSQSDTAANIHDVSWDYTTNLEVKYPVIDRYFITEALDAGYLDYVQTEGQPLVNILSYGSSTELFYVLSDDRDFFAQYRYRVEDSSDHTSAADQAVELGVDGKVILGIQGSLSVGYQIRHVHGVPPAGFPDEGNYGDLTGNGELVWTMNREVTVKGSASKDFDTTSTNATTDTTAGTLSGTWAPDSRLSFTAGVGGGLVRFYGPYGLLPNSTTERRDRYFSWNAGVTYAWNSHLTATLAYNYLRNWSNLATAQFDSATYSLTLTSRW